MARLFRKSDAPRRSLWDRVKYVSLLDVAVLARGGVSEGSLESLEALLLEADFGVPVTMRLVEEVRRRAARGEVKTDEDFRGALSQGVEAALRSGNADVQLQPAPSRPRVILVIGVNG